MFNPCTEACSAASVGLWMGGRFPAASLAPYIVAQVRNAQDIISGLLDEAEDGRIEPGRLRRATPAHVGDAPAARP